MTAPHDPESILAAWLEDGPQALPETTKRAIAVTTRTTRQSRRLRWVPWRFPQIHGTALTAFVVLAVTLAGLYILSPAPGAPGGVGADAGSGSPAPTVPPMTHTFTSDVYGYSVGYPADWKTQPASVFWSPPAWRVNGSPQEPLDFFYRTTSGPVFRAASAETNSTAIDDWITANMTFTDDPLCGPQRSTLPEIVIDGHHGRIRDSCGEVEVTVVVGQRVYLFTLFLGDSPLRVTYGRDLFDAIAATIQLRPEDAKPPPSPSPNPS